MSDVVVNPLGGMVMGKTEGDIVHITVYYTFKTHPDGSKQVLVLNDEKAKKMMEDPNKKKDVFMLNTKWKPLLWRDEHEIMKICTKSTDTGMPEVDWMRVRYERVKKQLIDWDLEYENMKIPVTEENVGKLPSSVAWAMVNKFEERTSISQEELGK